MLGLNSKQSHKVHPMSCKEKHTRRRSQAQTQTHTDTHSHTHTHRHSHTIRTPPLPHNTLFAHLFTLDVFLNQCDEQDGYNQLRSHLACSAAHSPFSLSLSFTPLHSSTRHTTRKKEGAGCSGGNAFPKKQNKQQQQQRKHRTRQRFCWLWFCAAKFKLASFQRFPHQTLPSSVLFFARPLSPPLFFLLSSCSFPPPSSLPLFFSLPLSPSESSFVSASIVSIAP